MIKGIKYFINKKILFALALLSAICVSANAQAASSQGTTQVAPIYFASDKKAVNQYLRRASDAASKKIRDQQQAKEQAAKKAADEKKAADQKQAEQAASAPRQIAFHNTAVMNGSNNYVYGTCTWYVKNMLPWVPSSLGNASNWAASAAVRGYLVDNSPAAGAVVVFAPGQAGASVYGHVGVVLSNNGDGSITISEGNFSSAGPDIRRVYAASSYLYIHP
ncbi:Surface antigen [Oenococcus kitaharae DSM 17330]|uniref:Surface antigen n=1 Tax=Oenococcus kitaharae DSM 17330 TaxID=1045004 RepID=G9WJ35_9LACO|nr:Surface antigen [Oenococcus kitaharae DSM 17330]